MDAIPAQFHSTLFPQPEVSIEELLKFSLPSQDRNATTTHPSVFFTSGASVVISTSNIQLLHTLPIPAQSTINALSDHFATSVMESTSVLYAHLPINNPSRSVRFPTWVIAYWLHIS
jgi:hypothetical protein